MTKKTKEYNRGWSKGYNEGEETGQFTAAILCGMGLIVVIGFYLMVFVPISESIYVGTLDEVCTELAGRNATFVQRATGSSFECMIVVPEEPEVEKNNILIY